LGIPSPVVDMSGSGSSSAEKCGFVTHLLAIGLGGCYLLGLALSHSSIDTASKNNEAIVWVASFPLWNRYLPTASLGVILIAPLIYALLNHLSAPSPQSVSSLQDAPTYSSATRRYDGTTVRPGPFESRMVAEAVAIHSQIDHRVFRIQLGNPVKHRLHHQHPSHSRFGRSDHQRPCVVAHSPKIQRQRLRRSYNVDQEFHRGHKK
jgi:hypothetical protein